MNESVAQVLAEVFRIDPASVGPETSPDTVGAWDSLGHFQLVAALESRFGVKFNLREIQTLETAGRIETVLGQKGVLETSLTGE